MPIRLGIIGMGFGAQVHLPAFASLPNVALVALADGGSGRARDIARDHAPAARVFSDPYALITDPDVDAVSIAVPPTGQGALVSAALAAGKHVLCEKPAGTSLAECTTLAAEAKRAGRIAAVGFQFRFERGLEALIAAVRQERCGTIERIAVSWFAGRGLRESLPFTWRCRHEMGGGMLREYASHCLDYIACMSGAPLAVDDARSAIRVPMRGMGNEAVTAEDECDILCRLPHNGVATIALSNVYARPTGHRVEVHGSEGLMVFEHCAPFDGHAPVASFTNRAGETVSLLAGDSGRTADGNSRITAWRSLARRFVQAIADGAGAFPDLPTLDDAVAVWRAIKACEAMCPTPATRHASGG